jgi:hypothetical protein
MLLQSLLSESNGATTKRPLALFAVLNLGIIESLASGLLSASDAVRVFFNADNCLFVRKRLRSKAADEVMSRGVQLPDLFTVLPTEEAHRQFHHELAAMRALCRRLLEGRQLVA